MTLYLDIYMEQTPFDMGLAADGRPEFAFNIGTLRVPGGEFAKEIAQRLVAEGVGVRGTDIFTGSRTNIPDSGGPYLLITETLGLNPLRIQNQAKSSEERPSAQISVIGATTGAVRAMCRAAYEALDGVKNLDLPSS